MFWSFLQYLSIKRARFGQADTPSLFLVDSVLAV